MKIISHLYYACDKFIHFLILVQITDKTQIYRVRIICKSVKSRWLSGLLSVPLVGVLFYPVSCILFLCIAIASAAQDSSRFTDMLSSPARLSFDSIKTALHYSPRIDFRIDTRNSFITNNFARITGVKIGFDYNKTVRVGLGYHWLSSNIYKYSGDQTGRLIFRYFSPYFEYTFYRTEKWEIEIPVHLGIGSAGYDFGFYKETAKFTMLYEPYMVGQYKIFSWFGIGFGVGYRLILIGNNAIDENFNSPMYILKVKLFPGILARKLLFSNPGSEGANNKK